MGQDHKVGANITSQLHRLFSIHRDLHRAIGKVERSLAQIKQGGSKVPLLSNLPQLVNVNRVAREVDRIRLSRGMSPSASTLL